MATFIILLFALVLLAMLIVGVVWAISVSARFISALLPPDTDPAAR